MDDQHYLLDRQNLLQSYDTAALVSQEPHSQPEAAIRWLNLHMIMEYVIVLKNWYTYLTVALHYRHTHTHTPTHTHTHTHTYTHIYTHPLTSMDPVGMDLTTTLLNSWPQFQYPPTPCRCCSDMLWVSLIDLIPEPKGSVVQTRKIIPNVTTQ